MIFKYPPSLGGRSATLRDGSLIPTGHTFVLRTNKPGYSNNGIVDNAKLLNDYLIQVTNPNAEQAIKLEFVSPPEVKVSDYITAMYNVIAKKERTSIGDDFTPLRIMQAIMRQTPNSAEWDTL